MSYALSELIAGHRSAKSTPPTVSSTSPRHSRESNHTDSNDSCDSGGPVAATFRTKFIIPDNFPFRRKCRPNSVDHHSPDIANLRDSSDNQDSSDYQDAGSCPNSPGRNINTSGNNDDIANKEMSPVKQKESKKYDQEKTTTTTTVPPITVTPTKVTPEKMSDTMVTPIKQVKNPIFSESVLSTKEVASTTTTASTNIDTTTTTPTTDIVSSSQSLPSSSFSCSSSSSSSFWDQFKTEESRGTNGHLMKKEIARLVDSLSDKITYEEFEETDLPKVYYDYRRILIENQPTEFVCCKYGGNCVIKFSGKTKGKPLTGHFCRGKSTPNLLTNVNEAAIIPDDGTPQSRLRVRKSLPPSELPGPVKASTSAIAAAATTALQEFGLRSHRSIRLSNGSAIEGLQPHEVREKIVRLRSIQSDRVTYQDRLPSSTNSFVYKLAFKQVLLDGVPTEYLSCNKCQMLFHYKKGISMTPLHVHEVNHRAKYTKNVANTSTTISTSAGNGGTVGGSINTNNATYSSVRIKQEKSVCQRMCMFEYFSTAQQKGIAQSVIRSELGMLVKNGSEQVSLVGIQGKSELWHHFRHVYAENNKGFHQPLDYVCCDHCLFLLKHKPGFGTKAMKQHLNRCVHNPERAVVDREAAAVAAGANGGVGGHGGGGGGDDDGDGEDTFEDDDEEEERGLGGGRGEGGLEEEEEEEDHSISTSKNSTIESFNWQPLLDRQIKSEMLEDQQQHQQHQPHHHHHQTSMNSNESNTFYDNLMLQNGSSTSTLRRKRDELPSNANGHNGFNDSEPKRMKRIHSILDPSYPPLPTPPLSSSSSFAAATTSSSSSSSSFRPIPSPLPSSTSLQKLVVRINRDEIMAAFEQTRPEAYQQVSKAFTETLTSLRNLIDMITTEEDYANRPQFMRTYAMYILKQSSLKNVLQHLSEIERRLNNQVQAELLEDLKNLIGKHLMLKEEIQYEKKHLNQLFVFFVGQMNTFQSLSLLV